jgi:glyoxylase-like metal-dependent hydrolase (beta-lactamase superfamily II)
VFFRQFVDADLGCASYLIGDQEAAEAVLVDPTFDVAPYLAEADRAGVRIARVLETHTHADHLSGHGRLALEHGVPVAIHEAAQVAYEHEPLVDGAEIRSARCVFAYCTRRVTDRSTAASSRATTC